MAHRQNTNRRRNSHRGKDSSPLTQDPQDVMSTAMRLQWNIRVLQRHDPAITTIVDQFTYVVLYRYEEDRWVKRGVEGSMFVYTRTDPPRHGFCILNREGAGNFVQPLRRGDELEITTDYIIFRPSEVGVDDFEGFIGIWTADLLERRRLSDFLVKITNHVSKTEAPYSPILLHQPLARPEDAALPLIQPLPPPPGSSPKKPRRNDKKGQQTPNLPASQAVASTPSQSVESEALNNLFAKLAAPSSYSSNAPKALPQAEELRGAALLQSMFASAATGSGAPAVTTTTSTLDTSAAVLSSVVSSQSTTSASGHDGIAEGNMLKQLLGIPVQTPPPTQAAASPPSAATITTSTTSAMTVADLLTSMTAAPPRPTSAVPPGFKPINEDEEATPPGTSHGAPPSTPPNKFNRPVDEQQTTPTPSSRQKRNGAHRELVAYDFEDDGEVVSPWMNEPLQRPRQENIIPPSPSQLPQPKAVRERKKNAGRRGVSPRPPSTQQTKQPQQPRHGNGYSSLVNQDVVGDAIMSALNGPGVPEEILTKERFAQDLLGLVQRNPLFIDVVYGKYLAMIESKRREAENVIYLD